MEKASTNMPRQNAMLQHPIRRGGGGGGGGWKGSSIIDQTIGRTNPNTVESKQQADPSDEGYQFLIFSE